jgi:transposase-like protein
MAKQRRSFSTSTEFKHEAASLVVDQGYSVAEAARAVDVGPSPLRHWVEQLREERDGVTPQSPWQRGSNENTNRPLRQYFPKKTDLSGYSQKQLNEFARKLNERPRKTLDYLTPVEKLKSIFALTG